MSTNPYQIWLEADGQKLLLPVNPERIDIKISGNNRSVTLAELGETSILDSPKASVISFSSFFPSAFFTGCQYAPQETMEQVGDFNSDGVTNVRDLAAKARMQGAAQTVSRNTMKIMPHYCINFILNIIKSKIPVKLTITKCDIIRFMSIESFNYSQSGGDVGTYSYSISFKDYRTISMKKIDVNKQTGKASVNNSKKRVVNTVRPKTYTVRPGDKIYDIAKKYYGDVADYRKIYEANKKLIGSNPNRIKPGMVLTLP